MRSELTACFGYHAATGLIFASAPLFCIAMGCGLAKIRDDQMTDEERLRSRSREVVQAATVARMQSLEARRSKTCRCTQEQAGAQTSAQARAAGGERRAAPEDSAAARNKKEVNAAARNKKRETHLAKAGSENGGGGGKGDAGTKKDGLKKKKKPKDDAPALLGQRRNVDDGAETCAVCQVDFEESEGCLACKHCDSGFHVRCLNTWLLRAETCPCCRAKISAV